jgi:hypothetical protein
MANRGTNKTAPSRSGDGTGVEGATKQKDSGSTRRRGRTSGNTASGRTNAGGADANRESKVLGEP